MPTISSLAALAPASVAGSDVLPLDCAAIADTGKLTIDNLRIVLNAVDQIYPAGVDVTFTDGTLDVTYAGAPSGPVVARSTNAAFTGNTFTSAITRAASAVFFHVYATSNGVPVFSVDGTGAAKLAGAIDVTAAGGFAIGSLPGRRRISASAAEVFDVVGDSNALCDMNGLNFISSSGFMARTSSAYGNGAAAAAATLTNAPVAGNPTKWVPIIDGATTRYIPAW